MKNLKLIVVIALSILAVLILAYLVPEEWGLEYVVAVLMFPGGSLILLITRSLSDFNWGLAILLNLLIYTGLAILVIHLWRRFKRRRKNGQE